ncbi:MAG: hypothetical protein ABEJ65_00550 [bacterium]
MNREPDDKKSTRDVIQWAREELGLSVEDIAEIIDVECSTIDQWPGKEGNLPKRNRSNVERLQTLKYHMESVFPDAEIRDEWLYHPSDNFDGDTPVEKLRNGELEPLIRQLATFDSGAFV